MSIPAGILEQWRKQGEDNKSATTYGMIRELLETHCSDIIDVNDNNVFLQGSYANHTNIKNDSDIDVVVIAHDVFSSNALEVLNESQYSQFRERYCDTHKTLESFKDQIYQRLNGITYKGYIINIAKGRKTIKFNQNNELWDYVPVDIVPAFEYRKYIPSNGIDKNKQVEGINIYDSYSKKSLINYPKLHKSNGEAKNSSNRTQGNYKETVRIFKNIKKHLIELNVIREDLISSYGLECLLYNVPDYMYIGSPVNRVNNILHWLSNNISHNFKEQSGMKLLFGETLNIDATSTFVNQCVWLSNNWR